MGSKQNDHGHFQKRNSSSKKFGYLKEKIINQPGNLRFRFDRMLNQNSGHAKERPKKSELYKHPQTWTSFLTGKTKKML